MACPAIAADCRNRDDGPCHDGKVKPTLPQAFRLTLPSWQGPRSGLRQLAAIARPSHDDLKRHRRGPHQLVHQHLAGRASRQRVDDDELGRHALGRQVDRELEANDVRLTVGGEPTFISIDDGTSAQWTTDADGRGPAWSNSLFEDNAEFGLGMRLGVDHHELTAKLALKTHAAEIGEQLTISPKTVDTYKQRINDKLGLTHRVDYVKLALKLGLLQTPL